MLTGYRVDLVAESVTPAKLGMNIRPLAATLGSNVVNKNL
jgi:hypothetical protein